MIYEKSQELDRMQVVRPGKKDHVAYFGESYDDIVDLNRSKFFDWLVNPNWLHQKKHFHMIVQGLAWLEDNCDRQIHKIKTQINELLDQCYQPSNLRFNDEDKAELL